MNLPLVPYGVASLVGLTDWLRTLATSIAAGWNVEHTATGAHDWHWTTPAFDANRFQGDGTITWTVASADRVAETYAILGDVMLWTLQVGSSSTGGTASTDLRVVLPDGYRLAGKALHPAAYGNDNGTEQNVYLEGEDGSRYIAARQGDGGNWSNASTNSTYLYFSIWLRVTR